MSGSMSEVTILTSTICTRTSIHKDAKRALWRAQSPTKKKGRRYWNWSKYSLFCPSIGWSRGRKDCCRVLNEEHFATLGNNERRDGVYYPWLEAYESKSSFRVNGGLWRVPPFCQKKFTSKQWTTAALHLSGWHYQAGQMGIWLENQWMHWSVMIRLSCCNLGIEMDHLIVQKLSRNSSDSREHICIIWRGKWVNQTLLTGGFKYGAAVANIEDWREFSDSTFGQMIAVEDLKSSTVDGWSSYSWRDCIWRSAIFILKELALLLRSDDRDKQEFHGSIACRSLCRHRLRRSLHKSSICMRVYATSVTWTR